MKYKHNEKDKLNNKKISINHIVIMIVFVLVVVYIFNKVNKYGIMPVSETEEKQTSDIENTVKQSMKTAQNMNFKEENKQSIEEQEYLQLEWNLTLVNQDNKIPENYNINLESIDEYRKFDSRAINYLKAMLNDMKRDGIKDIWVQSAYRSIEKQTEIYNNKVEEYMQLGKTREQAKSLTEETINKPGYSEHNLGLSLDFNYVNKDFEKTKAFSWLKQNAENYGFILRYPKEKENITKVKYEPWHWRYVGKEHAKKINELNMCLEEYIEYLNNENKGMYYEKDFNS